jgi:hypothetical protein
VCVCVCVGACVSVCVCVYLCVCLCVFMCAHDARMVRAVQVTKVKVSLSILSV